MKHASSLFRVLCWSLLFSLVPSMYLVALDFAKDVYRPGLDLVGTPYRYGGAEPDGFDCSGFVTYLYKPHVGSLPRSSRDQARYGTAVDRPDLQRGDLVFFATLGARNGVSHVAVYAGDDTIIHSVSNGPQTGVVVNRLSARYWDRTYHSARRIVDFEAAGPEDTADAVGDPSRDAVDDRQGNATRRRTEAPDSDARPDEAPATPAPATESGTSPWDSYDGPVYGDFEEFARREESAFERFREEEQKGFAPEGRER